MGESETRFRPQEKKNFNGENISLLQGTSDFLLNIFCCFFYRFFRAQNRTFIKVVIDFLFRFSSPTDTEKMHTQRAVRSFSCILRRLYTKFILWAHNLLLQTRLARDVYPNLIKSFILQLGTPYKFALSKHHLGYFFRCKWASWEKFVFKVAQFFISLSLYLLSNLSAHSLYTIVGKLRFLIWATLLCIIYSLSSLCSSTSRKKTASLIFFLQNRMMTLIIFFQPSFLTPSTMSYQWRTDKNVSFFRAIRDNCFENSSLWYPMSSYSNDSDTFAIW